MADKILSSSGLAHLVSKIKEYVDNAIAQVQPTESAFVIKDGLLCVKYKGE